MSIKAENDITLVRVDDGQPGSQGPTGKGVANVTKEFYLSTSKTTPTGGSWSNTAPLWSNGKYLWTRDKIVYTNPSSTEYTTPQCDSSWEAVNLVEIGARNLASINNIQAYSTTANREGYEFTQVVGKGAGLNFPDSIFEENQKYVLSFSFQKISGTLTSMAGHCAAFETYDVVINGQSISPNNWSSAHTIQDSDEIQTCVVYLRRKNNSEITGSSDYKLYIQPQRSSYHDSNDITIKYWNIKLELGNKATDWTPAPEDMASIEGLESLTTDFNEAEEVINSTRADVDDITENVSGLNTSVENLNSVTGELSNQLSEELVAKGYAKITSEPSLELGRGASDWKVKITNSSVDLQKAGVNGARLGANPERANETLFQADTTRISNLYFRSADSQGKLGIVAQSNGHISLKEI